MNQILLKSVDGYELCLNLFEVENAKATIQVMHGMEEHKERYTRLALDLNKNGYNVVVPDMRGHGEHAEILGYFSKKDGDKLLVEDQVIISNFIKERYKTKIYIFAHSMGTITCRNLLMQHSNDYEKVVLSGYPNPQPIAGLAVAISSVVQFFRGDKYFSRFVENLAVGSFNKSIKNPRTDFDWLSYNEKNVDDYIKDPFCGHGFKISSCKTLFKLVQNLGKVKNYINVNKDLPILLISGEDDPCTGKEKGRNASLEVLKKAGFNKNTVITYPKMRHEMLNEDKYDLVHSDIINFYNF